MRLTPQLNVISNAFYLHGKILSISFWNPGEYLSWVCTESVKCIVWNKSWIYPFFRYSFY